MSEPCSQSTAAKMTLSSATSFATSAYTGFIEFLSIIYMRRLSASRLLRRFSKNVYNKLFLDSLASATPWSVEHKEHWFLLFDQLLNLLFIFNMLDSISFWIFKPRTVRFRKSDKIFKLLRLVFNTVLDTLAENIGST